MEPLREFVHLRKRLCQQALHRFSTAPMVVPRQARHRCTAQRGEPDEQDEQDIVRAGQDGASVDLRLRGFGVGLICDRSDGDLAYGYDQLWRDAALIGTGAVQVIYRLRHCDIEARLSDILYIVARSDSALFSERGQINLARLASDQARSTRLRQEYVEIRYPADLDDDPSGDPEDTVVASEIAYGDSLQLIRRDRPGLAFWYQYLRNSGARTSQEVMRRFADEHLRTDEEPA